jgi:sensor c-di-GMP phosphodiesterase-like protein
MLQKPLARTVFSMLGMAVATTSLALLIGEFTVQRQQQVEAAELAGTYITRTDRISAEANDALARIARLPATDCSEDEVGRLRGIVLTSQHIKVASRLRQGELVCTSTIGRVEPPVALPTPDFVDAQGRRVVLSTPQLGIPDASALMIAQGDAVVTVNGRAYADAVDPRLSYAVVAETGGKRRVLFADGPTLELDQIPLRTGEAFDVQDRRYEVRCSNSYAGCIVATLRQPGSILRSPVLLEFGMFGLLLGLSGGFVLSSLIGRSNSLGRQLRLALHSGKLKLVYQPIVRLTDRRRVGAEALLRWTDTTGKQVSPDAFISVAEQDGFINEITRFVINHVLQELGDELRRRPDYKITVNVAASDIMDGSFLPFLTSRLHDAGLKPASIGLELTERTTANSREMGRAIARLREAGYKVYIDDFGTDYSSLSYLSRLRVDAIKINRTFMQALHDQSDQDTIAPQIVAMAEVLGLGIVIEGIEEENQAAYFLTLAPHALAQGWLFSKPVEASKLFGS